MRKRVCKYVWRRLCKQIHFYIIIIWSQGRVFTYGIPVKNFFLFDISIKLLIVVDCPFNKTTNSFGTYCKAEIQLIHFTFNSTWWFDSVFRSSIMALLLWQTKTKTSKSINKTIIFHLFSFLTRTPFYLSINTHEIQVVH